MVALSVSSLSQEIPGPADPGQVERRFDKPASPRATEGPDVVLRRSARQAKDVRRTPFPTQRPSDRWSDGIRTRRIISTLSKVYRPTGISYGVGNEIARQVTRKYRRDVYILSRAIVPGSGGSPMERLEFGSSKVTSTRRQVRLAEIDQDRWKRPSFTSDANKILASRPLRAMDLERYLLLAVRPSRVQCSQCSATIG